LKKFERSLLFLVFRTMLVFVRGELCCKLILHSPKCAAIATLVRVWGKIETNRLFPYLVF
jgi:hypothetical protein